jgi:hypothetical protein
MPARIDIINAALAEIGAKPLANEDAATGAIKVVQYDRLVTALMAYPWTFQSTIKKLVRLTAKPTARWLYAYQLPLSDMLGAPRAIYNSFPASDGLPAPFLGWDRFADQIWSDEIELWMRYTTKPDPNLWPGYFNQVVVEGLKSEFALSVREDLNLYKTLRDQVYGNRGMPGDTGILGQAKSVDASSVPSRSIPMVDNPLVSVRLT